MKRTILYLLWLITSGIAGICYGQTLVLHYKAETQPDSSQPVEFVVYDTATVVDTNDLGLPARKYLLVHQWPDSLPLKLFGVRWNNVKFSPVKPFTAGSIEVLDAKGKPYEKSVWWSGLNTMLQDSSVLKPMKYKLEGDSLVRR